MAAFELRLGAALPANELGAKLRLFVDNMLESYELLRAFMVTYWEGRLRWLPLPPSTTTVPGSRS
jgi:hypothetical protein